MVGLDLADQVSPISWTPQYKVVLSWDLLDCITIEDKIPCSFTNFITTPELSGPLYIRPGIYHSQITEYSLQTIYRSSDSFFKANWSFKEHLSRALPTDMIFCLLRSIRSGHLKCDNSAESIQMPDTLEIIIKWLQGLGLGSELPSVLYDRFQGELLRHKAFRQR